MINETPSFKKGNSLLEFTNNYVVVDVATTGHTLFWDDILDIAAIKVLDGKVVESFYTLVKPLEFIDPHIKEKTGFSNESFENAPTIEDALTKLINFIDDFILVTHYSTHAINFICSASSVVLNTSIDNNFIDTLRWAKRLLIDSPSNRLQDLAEYLNLKHRPSLRSIDDCYAIMDLYEYMKNIGFDYKPTKNQRKKLSSKSVLEQVDVSAIIEKKSISGITFTFTGELSMIREDAYKMIFSNGGFISDNVTKRTDILVNASSTDSSKVKKALELQKKGHSIKIINENDFLDLFKKED